MIECFGAGESAKGSSISGGGGANVADIFEGLGFGCPAMDEKRIRAVTDAFRELDEDGSSIIRAGNLRRRYDAAAAASCDSG